jgi:hypothetical protein
MLCFRRTESIHAASESELVCSACGTATATRTERTSFAGAAVSDAAPSATSDDTPKYKGYLICMVRFASRHLDRPQR